MSRYSGVVIAIDGPAAAGKGTLARRLAQALGLRHLDTGLLYRAVARRVLDAGADPSDAEAATEAARTLAGSDLDRSDLRSPEVDAAASQVAAIAPVRQALLEFQRRFPGARGAVLDGRDIGTAVFPEAAAKLFVTASTEARALRRWRELRDRGVSVDLPHVRQEMAERDRRDAERATAPLRPANDAVLIDTTELDAEAAFAAALEAINRRLDEVAGGQK